MSYQSVDALQSALANGAFKKRGSPKKAAGRALGTVVEIITFYMIRQWELEDGIAIERRLPEYGSPAVTHNVEFTLHGSRRVAVSDIPKPVSKSMTTNWIKKDLPHIHAGEPKKGNSLINAKGVVRHGFTIGESDRSFFTAITLPSGAQYAVNELSKTPYAMFECKRVGVEEGQARGPQAIEKAKQGAYVARSVSGLQRVPRRDGTVAAIVENADGDLQTHENYYDFLQGAITRKSREDLDNIVLTVGVVSNHGNWFSSGNQSKEIKVLAQSYDWLLFLTDAALSEFIETVLQGKDPRFKATRAAFDATHAQGRTGSTTFTKIMIDFEADKELTDYFERTKPWEKWFNVITPAPTKEQEASGAKIDELRLDLRKLAEIYRGAKP
ncbi:hypothetical protein [Corynebacterium sputi]|uniref:hypothetical protein n=1 Tax=Corynebacterium sputi TaxID=489915 RepID=UPI000421B401|nr:hypothetical protein [Corynebacterium sputi]